MTPRYISIAREQLKIDEGTKLKPYKDTVGKLTIGTGRNLDDKGLNHDEVALMLENDIRDAELDARVLFPCFDRLSDERKAVLLNLAFNLGRERLSKFKKFRKALEESDYEEAAKELGNSKWASQVGPRATRLITKMREG